MIFKCVAWHYIHLSATNELPQVKSTTLLIVGVYDYLVIDIE